MARKRIRRYTDEKGKVQPFRVFISHGRTPLLNKVKRFIEEELNFATEVLVDRFQGAVILDKLEDATWECECAVVIMTPDDRMAETGAVRARQNVIHEIGYLQGLHQDRELVVILKEESVEWFSNLHGIEYISFSGQRISAAFPKLRQALDDIFAYYKDDEE